MRLCLFTPTFLPLVGGTEIVTDALARHLSDRGHEVVVLAHGRPVSLDVPYRVCWYSKPLLHRLYPERIGRHLLALHQRERFDLIAANYGTPTGWAAVRFGRRTGVPVVVVSHGGDLYRSSMRRRHPHLWRRVERAYRGADGLVCISPYIESLIREINPRPRLMEMIPNGVDVADVNRPAPTPPDVDPGRSFCLCLGNLGPMKGFDDAITAYARARENLDSTALFIVGSGRLDAQLRRQVRDLGLDREVLFAGPRHGSEKRWFLHNCRFGLMPSIEEGHPIVGLELLAAGKPVICSDNAAFDGMYDDGENALRVPARRPDLLAEAMLRMHRSDLKEMGDRSRRRAEAYDWPAVARRYEAFFNRVLDRAQSSGHGLVDERAVPAEEGHDVAGGGVPRDQHPRA